MSISIQEFVKMANTHKQHSKETLQTVLKAIRDVEEMEKQMKEIRECLNTVFKAPKSFNTIEKVVYYFNRKQNVTLQEIADEGGYEISYLLKVSMRVNNKLKKIQ